VYKNVSCVFNVRECRGVYVIASSVFNVGKYLSY